MTEPRRSLWGRQSLRARLLVATVAPMLTIIAIVLGIDFQVRREAANSDLVEQTTALVTSLEHDISRLAFAPDRERSLDVVRRLESHAHIERLYAFGDDGRILLAYQTPEWVHVAPPRPSVERGHRTVDGHLEIRARIGDYATVQVVADTHTVRLAERSALTTSLLLGLGLVTFAILGVLGLQRSLVRRIDELQSTAAAVVATGDYSRRVPEGPDDELGTIALGLNSLLSTVQSTLGSLTTEVTERAAAQDELARVVDAVEQSLDGIVITDGAGRIQFANHAFENITGFGVGEVVGMTHHILRSSEQPSEVYDELWNTLTSGRTWARTLVHQRKDGEQYHDRVRITPRLADGLLLGCIAVHRDVSDHVEIERQLHESQRLDSLGRLAGGVAHDFNNLLTVILGQASLIEERDPDAGADLIVGAVERAAELTGQLLSFSRSAQFELRPVDVAGVLAELERMLARVVPANITVAVHSPGPGCRVRADPGRLQQVLLNLAINARDAMPDGGCLTISAREVERPSDDGVTQVCQIRVADTGHGMDADTLSHALEPFFTTKDAGGTGLGLSTAYGIMRQFDGRLTLQSAPDRGTVVELELPRSVSAPSTPTLAVVGAGTPTALTILVAEDEPMVRVVTERLLREAGHEVLCATDAEDALVQWSANAAQIDLLVTDMMMPGMSGAQLTQRLRAERPGLPVVLVSGYTEDPAVRSLAEGGAFAFLRKPYRPHQLLDAVGRLMQEQARRQRSS